MASEVLIYLAYLAAILIIGLFTSVASHKFRIPHSLLILLAGIVVGKVQYNNAPLMQFPHSFILSISVLALVAVSFDAASKFKLNNLDFFSSHTLWFSLVSLVFNFIFLSAAAIMVFGFKPAWLVIAFAVVMTGTDFEAFLILKKAKSQLFEFLEIESMFNALLSILLAFMILDFNRVIGEEALSFQIAWPLIQNLAVSIAAGVLIGLVMFKFIGRKYSAISSPLAVIACALAAYIFAERISGNGVLAVVSMGILFGNIHLKHKEQLHSFASVFSSSLEVLVFFLIGLTAPLLLSFDFFIKSLFLFFIYILIRFSAMLFSLRGMHFGVRNKLILALNAPKGIVAGAIIFAFASLNIGGIESILGLSVAFMVYSNVLYYVVGKMA